MSLERNIDEEDEFRVSGGSEFQIRGPMTEKALLPSDDRTYGMERNGRNKCTMYKITYVQCSICRAVWGSTLSGFSQEGPNNNRMHKLETT